MSRPSIGAASERLLRTSALSDGIGRLRYVSGTRQEALERLGIHTVQDLFLDLPRHYIDLTCVTPIALADVGTQATVRGVADKVKVKQPRPRMKIVEVSVLDDTGVLVVSFFKQPWIADQIHEGDVLVLQGKISFSYGFKEMKSPFFENLGPKDQAGASARILPVHAVGEGITQAWMRRIESSAVADLGDVSDFMPASLVALHGLMSEARAIRQVQFPHSMAAAERGRRRLAYDELLLLQLALLTRTRLESEGLAPVQHIVDGPRAAAVRAALPFALTDEQDAAVSEIFSDMASPHLMNRLLLGDVGTGKTAVAAVAIGAVADTGTQAAVMAPTSVLARQYAEKMGPVLDEAGIRWALITGATPEAERRATTEGIQSGAITAVFGTTAILSEDVNFSHLSLAVIDEQHRFGVGQRALLRNKGAGADLLTMTATPIPRTLALSVYGDLSVSRIRKRPVKGAGIATKVLAPENADLAYGAIREAVAKGQQAYVVCPLVDAKDTGDELDDVPDAMKAKPKELHAATVTAERLSRDVFPGMRVALLHGRMSAQDKDEVMGRFAAGEIDVLVSTTVIEVGVDVPNATVMIVFDADRFGLATLHQLRGRVGRGKISGQVFLVAAARKGSPARKRLSALEKSSDGFELAELDLSLRHEGELLGYRQSGGVALRVADLAEDTDLVQYAYVDARNVAEEDPALEEPEHVLLAQEMRARFGAYFEEVERA